MAWSAPDTYTVGQLLTASSMNKLSGNFTAGFAVGSKMFAAAISGGNATETQWQGGWLECNGAQVSRTTYSSLFNYLNALTTPLPYGTGNGTTTFTLPDYQGRAPIHHSVSGPAAVSTLGNSDGVAVANRRPQHRHTPHNHGGQTGGPSKNTTEANTNGFSANTALGGADGFTQTHTHAIASGDGGSGNANDSLDAPSYLVGGIWVVKF